MKRLAGVLLILAVVAAAVVYNVRARNAPPPAASPTPAASGGVAVTVSTARHRTMGRSLTLVGTLRSDRQAAITARVPGRIGAIFVREGDAVRRGQALAHLDIGDTRAQVAGAAAGIEAAEAQYQKAVDGKRARAVEMDAQIAQADGGLRTALARRRQAELAVQLTDKTAASDTERARAAVRQAEAGVRQAETGLAQADDTVRRLEFLYSKGGIPRVDLEGARAQAEIARAQRDSAVAALQQARAAEKPAVETAPLRTQVSQADVEAARAGVRQAEAGLRNARRARGEALRIADADIVSARAQRDQARAGHAQAVSQVGSSDLTSPFDGIVTDLAAHAGEMAQPGMPLMTVISPAAAYLEVAAPARYAASFRPGLPARIFVDTQPSVPLEGSVERVLPVTAGDSRSVPLRIRLQAARAALTPGAMARAVVELPRDRNAISIPVDALRSEGSTTFVYVVSNDRAERRNVTLGAMEDQYVQILSGLSYGDTVILTGPASLQPGTAVSVVGR